MATYYFVVDKHDAWYKRATLKRAQETAHDWDKTALHDSPHRVVTVVEISPSTAAVPDVILGFVETGIEQLREELVEAEDKGNTAVRRCLKDLLSDAEDWYELSKNA
jgi:hypothetical protein